MERVRAVRSRRVNVGVQAGQEESGLTNGHDDDSNDDGVDATSSAGDMLQVLPLCGGGIGPSGSNPELKVLLDYS